MHFIVFYEKLTKDFQVKIEGKSPFLHPEFQFHIFHPPNSQRRGGKHLWMICAYFEELLTLFLFGSWKCFALRLNTKQSCHCHLNFPVWKFPCIYVHIDDAALTFPSAGQTSKQSRVVKDSKSWLMRESLKIFAVLLFLLEGKIY